MRTAAWTRSVSVLDRLSAVLDAFGVDGEGLSVSELARRANLPKSTVSRIAADLVEQGYLDREGAMLHLGVRLFELGQNVAHPQRLRRLSRPFLARLRDATGHDVRLAVPDGDQVVIVAHLRARDAAGSAPTIGERLPRRDSALGAAIDAFPDGGRSPGGGDVGELRARTHGDAICLAVPVVDRQHPIAAMSVGGEQDAVDHGIVAPLLRSAASGLSRRLSAP